MLGILAIGCKGKKPDVAKGTEKRNDEAPKRQGKVQTGSGSLVRFSETPKRWKAWDVSWTEGSLEFKDGEQPGGEIRAVTGTVWTTSGEPSTYSADRAVVQRNSNVLNLDGHVNLLNTKRKAKVACNHLTWDPDKQVIVATGNVQYRDPILSVSGQPEVWVKPDLSRIGTKEMFTVNP